MNQHIHNVSLIIIQSFSNGILMDCSTSHKSYPVTPVLVLEKSGILLPSAFIIF
ncbi:MAG: hypothetical protein ACMUIU_17210 [bacterium]